MKRQFTYGLFIGLAATLTAHAAAISEHVYWYDGDHAGQKAATCVYHTPDRQPFSDEVTLVVDNAQPYGTVLWVWDYATFLPDYMFSCTGSGVSNSTHRLQNPARGHPPEWQLRLTVPGSNELTPTTNPGVGVRWYFRTSQGEKVKTQAPLTAAVSLEVTSGADGRYVFNPGKTVSLSAKAELIKIGDVVHGKNISLPPAQSQLRLEAGMTKARDENLGQGGITPIAPACRLSTKDYKVDMGRWVTLGRGQLPATGSETPFDLQLECSGQVTHLRLRFEDTGKRQSLNHNITLYRAANGESVEGLEIEMLFNGNRINMGDGKSLDVGARGHHVQNSTPVYGAAAPVALTARYIQHHSITSGATPYTGNISGSVNIWMTYD